MPWAVCGIESLTYDDEAPTCLGCIAEKWLALDNREHRYINWLGNKIAAGMAIPPAYVGYSVATLKPDDIIEICQTTPTKP